MAAKNERNRFQSDAGKYAAYLATPEGQLRVELAFANILELLEHGKDSLRVLDLGCGTGLVAVRLARLGFQVTLLDSSPAMLDLAQRAVQEARVADRISLKLGDATRLSELFTNELFDVIVCHNILEYVDDPPGLLRSVRRLMRNPSAILSVLVRTQAGEVLKAALQTGDLAAAEHNLTAEWGQESLYGGKVRLFTWEALDSMLKTSSLTPAVQKGVRIISDYLPPQISRSEEYERIFELERNLGRRQEFFGIARYMQVLARYVELPSEIEE
jgi:S-adenosylmethionine-dependent methyltransferase